VRVADGARVVQVSVSAGGVPKRAVPSAWLGPLGLEGDAHRFRAHGGPDRALCLYALEQIDALRAEGHAIEPGAAGENVTVQGLDWARLAPGDRLRIGAAVVELTSYAVPCATISHLFADGRARRISQDVRPGWSRLYARVLTPGRIAARDQVDTLTIAVVSAPQGEPAR
jgi:MOSC domain-containing protein YiiM